MISVLVFKLARPVSNERGFTLLSLVFLILVLSFAGTAVVATLLPSALTRQYRETSDQAQLLRSGLQAYSFQHGGTAGTHASSLDALVASDGVACLLDLSPTSATYLNLQGWCGPYVDQLFAQDSSAFKRDGWGTLFTYNSVTQVIASCGPNRTCGDGDDLSYAP